MGDREDLLVDGRVVGYVQGSQWLAKRTLDTVEENKLTDGCGHGSPLPTAMVT